MRRYTSLLLTAFLLFILVVAGSAYFAGARQDDRNRPLREIVVYTTLPAEHASILTNAYEQSHNVRVNFVPLSSGEIIKRLQAQAEAGDEGAASMVLADKDTLNKAAVAGYFTPYLSEAGDQVPENFRQRDGYWVGVWYDPIVFCMNKDYLLTLPLVPDTWKELAAQPQVRIGSTDCLAADTPQGGAVCPVSVQSCPSGGDGRSGCGHCRGKRGYPLYAGGLSLKNCLSC